MKEIEEKTSHCRNRPVHKIIRVTIEPVLSRFRHRINRKGHRDDALGRTNHAQGTVI